MIQPLVASITYYCTAPLAGPQRDVLLWRQWLQQNSAARIVTTSKKHQHISPALDELHWLPVKYKVVSKVLLYLKVHPVPSLKKKPKTHQMLLYVALSMYWISMVLKSHKDISHRPSKTLLNISKWKCHRPDNLVLLSSHRTYKHI